ncbi:MAG TPA: hypothetical protein VH206_12445 [Xanthobacteraceae bacterium]|jgi:hypothetical protein|nr:hypothetical protein [Xanthobacteraceae bacterium]
MFPNLRVMVVALLASIVGIGCGLATLAVLRVNHQPYTRLQSGEPPLQLAYGTGTPTLVSDGTPSPFGVRFEVKEPASPRMTVPVPASAPSDPPASSASSPDEPTAKTEVQPEPEHDAKLESKPTADTASSQDDVVAIVAGLISDTAVPEVAPAQTFAPVQTAEPAETKTAEIAVPAETKPAQIAVTPETAPIQVVSPAEPTLTVKSPEADQPMTTAAITPDNTMVMPARSEALAPLPAPKKENEVRHHAAKRAKRARIVSTTVTADSNFASPTYQSTLQGTAAETPFIGLTAQSEPRRVVLKRRHPAKKAAAQATNTKPDTPATVATTKR